MTISHSERLSDDTRLRDIAKPAWQSVPDWIAMNHAVDIRAALDNLWGYPPDVVRDKCKELARSMNADQEVFNAVWRWLSAPDRRRFKEYVGAP